MMSSFDESRNFELGPDSPVFVDLVDQLGFVVDDAFNDSLRSYRADKPQKSVVDLVQIDTHSLVDEKLFSVLLTESGGKPDYGVEKIRVLARMNDEYSSVREAVASLLEDYSTLPYKTDSYFVAHQSKSGEWRYSRIDEQGIHAWLPNLSDLHSEVEYSLDDIDIMSAIEEATMQSSTTQDRVSKRQLRQLDRAYAEELIVKLDEWAIVPQN